MNDNSSRGRKVVAVLAGLAAAASIAMVAPATASARTTTAGPAASTVPTEQHKAVTPRHSNAWEW